MPSNLMYCWSVNMNTQSLENVPVTSGILTGENGTIWKRQNIGFDQGRIEWA